MDRYVIDGVCMLWLGGERGWMGVLPILRLGGEMFHCYMVYRVGYWRCDGDWGLV